MVKPSTVVKFFGSVRKTAEFFGVEVQSVYLWLYDEKKKRKSLPKERLYELNLRLPEHFPYQGR